MSVLPHVLGKETKSRIVLYKIMIIHDLNISDRISEAISEAIHIPAEDCAYGCFRLDNVHEDRSMGKDMVDCSTMFHLYYTCT
jgi:hypothetical protein